MTPSPYIVPGLPAPTTEQIIAAVCDVCKVSREVLTSKNKLRIIVEARHIAMLLIRHCSNSSAHEIGLIFRKDHSTVLYALRTASHLLVHNKEFKSKFKNVTHRVFATEEDRTIIFSKITKENETIHTL